MGFGIFFFFLGHDFQKFVFIAWRDILQKKNLEKWPNVFTFLVGHDLIVKV